MRALKTTKHSYFFQQATYTYIHTYTHMYVCKYTGQKRPCISIFETKDDEQVAFAVAAGGRQLGGFHCEGRGRRRRHSDLHHRQLICKDAHLTTPFPFPHISIPPPIKINWSCDACSPMQTSSESTSPTVDTWFWTNLWTTKAGPSYRSPSGLRSNTNTHTQTPTKTSMH